MFNPYYNPNYLPQQPNIIFALVRGLDGAKSYPIPPNGKAILMDFDSSYFWFKSSDSLGHTEVRTFTFTEEKVVDSVSPLTSSNDFTELNTRIAKIESQLSDMLKNIDKVKEA